MSALTVFKGDRFKGKVVKCDEQFVPTLQKIEKYAEECSKDHKLDIVVLHSFRPLNERPPGGAEMSNHYAGHAIDINIRYDGKYYNSKAFGPSNLANLPQEVQSFFSKIRKDKTLRWGGDCFDDPWHIDDGLNANLRVWQERVNALQKPSLLVTKGRALKSVAKVPKHSLKFKIPVALLAIMIATNTAYYLGAFKMNPVLQPAQQTMNQIWSVPGLSQVRQFISQIVAGNAFVPGLTPARDLVGTWKTSFPVTFYIASNETGELQTHGTESRTMTWIVTATDRENVVDVKISFTCSNQQLDEHSGYVPDVSPMSLKGLISGPRLVLETGHQMFPNDIAYKPIGPEPVQQGNIGNFTYTTSNMQGTWHDDWTMLGFEQDVFTGNNALILAKQ